MTRMFSGLGFGASYRDCYMDPFLHSLLTLHPKPYMIVCRFFSVSFRHFTLPAVFLAWGNSYIPFFRTVDVYWPSEQPR